MGVEQQTAMRRRGYHRFLHDESGVALVEFSLIVMMMTVLAFGSINWARFFLLRGQLADAIRDAARYGATLEMENWANAGGVTGPTAIATYARTLMANSTTAPLGGTLTVTYPGTIGTDRRVRVELTGFPFVRTTTLGMGAGRTITVAAEYRRER